MIMFLCLILSLIVTTTLAFQLDNRSPKLLPGSCQLPQNARKIRTVLLSSSSTDDKSSVEDIATLKTNLIRSCQQGTKPSKEEICILVDDLESVAEQKGEGQSSSFTGLLSGDWELIYSPEDVTRSSPFFWAFSKAFPDSSDQIYGITDAIPSPIKDVGPAYQNIDLNTDTQSGTFVSRVKVATLGGLATSIMTTRASIEGLDGIDGIRLKIETTKPEDSTAIKTLFGPLGDIVNENAPPFPSGEALEKAKPGSSEVILRTTFCDEGLRISRNDEKYNEVYVWVRNDFPSFDV